MKTWPEIAGVAFLFTAGVAASVYTGTFPGIISTTYHIIASATILLSAALLIYSLHRRWNSRLLWSLVAACAISCGAFTGMSGIEMQISEIPSEGPLTITAHKAAKGLESLIGSVPFAYEDTGGIIKALLTGNREDIPKDVVQAFSSSGASHILALSGLHLGIIYAIILRLLAFAGSSPAMRRAKSALTIIICGFYTLATGAGASITRAFIFITLNETGKMAGRPTSLKGVLAASLLLHLAFDPTAVSEAGFQLSYAALFGIAFIYPWLRDMWRNDWRGLKWIWESAAVSISCQITTSPLAYFYFGTFPQYFLMTNLIAVPLAGLIIPAALLVAALTALGCCPAFLISATEWLVTALTDSLSIIASM